MGEMYLHPIQIKSTILNEVLGVKLVWLKDLFTRESIYILLYTFHFNIYLQFST